MTLERLVDRLKPLNREFVENISIGNVAQFEAMTKVDYDYFWRRISPTVHQTDEFGYEMYDDEGDPILIPDPEALNNPQPIPNKTRCLATLVWMRNRDDIAGLTVGKLEDELSYVELWSLLNRVGSDGEVIEAEPAGDGDSPLEETRSLSPVSENEPLTTGTESVPAGS